MLQTKDNRAILKITGFFGIISPFITFTLILLAIAFYPQFSLVKNALSDLGVVPGVTSMLFNNSLVLAGFFLFIFAVGLFFYFKENIIGRIDAVILAIATLFLIGIGIFTEDVPFVHNFVSLMFFSLLEIALLVSGVAFAFKRKLRLALFVFILALFAPITWLSYYTTHFVPNLAIPESISGLAGAIWILTLSYLMIKKATNKI